MTGAGDLRHRVVFQQRVLEPDGGGGFTGEWEDLESHATDYAEIKALSALARFVFGQHLTEATHALRLRWRDDVQPRMRAVSGTAFYRIVSALDRDGRKEWLDLIAVRED